MPTLGPYLISSQDGHFNQWCYFSFESDHSTMPVYYTARNASTGQEVHWEQSRLEDKKLLYVYDITLKKPTCYFTQEGKFFEIPRVQRGKEFFLSGVSLIQVKGDKIETSLANGKRARTYKVDLEQYRTPGEQEISDAPPIPVTVSDTQTMSLPSAISIEINTVKEALQVKQCLPSNRKKDRSSTLEEGCMYVWQQGQAWHFTVQLLGEIKTGVFNQTLDSAVIQHLNITPIDKTSSMEAIRLQLSRPYLDLTAGQQASIVQNLSFDWKLIASRSIEDQKKMLRAIAMGDSTTIDNLDIKSDINAFRPHFFLANLNRIYGMQPEFKNTTIAAILTFQYQLLQATAGLLGDTDFPSITIPHASDVNCGMLPENNNSASSLIYSGLSASESHLFQWILTAEMNGIEALPLENLLELSTALSGILYYQPEFQQLADDLLVGITANQNLSNESAKIKMQQVCIKLRNQLTPIIFKQFSGLDPATLVQLNNTLTADHYHAELIFWWLQSEVFTGEQGPMNRSAVARYASQGFLTQDNVIALVQHGTLYELCELFSFLEENELITQDNVATIVQHAHPSALLEIFIVCKQFGLLTQDNVATIVQHADLSNLQQAMGIMGAVWSTIPRVTFTATLNHPQGAVLYHQLYEKYITPSNVRSWLTISPTAMHQNNFLQGLQEEITTNVALYTNQARISLVDYLHADEYNVLAKIVYAATFFNKRDKTYSHTTQAMMKAIDMLTDGAPKDYVTGHSSYIYVL